MAGTKIVVLYHADCEDGLGGAWVAHSKFGDKASYIPVKYGFPPPNVKDKAVYMIDFTYSESVMADIVKDAVRVISIDHHISVKRLCESLDDHLFSIKHSGAVLAFKYFYPDRKMPLILRYIEDIDLWKFSMRDSDKFSGFIRSIPYDLKSFNKLARNFEDPIKRRGYMKEGLLILRYNNSIIEYLISNGSEVLFEKKRAFAVNSPVLNSEIGGEILKRGYPVAIIWAAYGRYVKISLRSGRKVDVSKIASRYGGGGHHSASGFELPLNKKFPWKKL